jgi:acetolactate synthase-1/2/3 large subunit
MSPGEPMTAVDVLVRCLEAEGVEYIFGIPGGPLTPLYEALSKRSQIRPILTKHEAGAAFMANGYARVSGRLGVCCATSGPGGTNAVTGIAASFADSVPVLLLTGEVATAAFGQGAAQEGSSFGVDLVEIFKPVTRLSTMLMNPERTQGLVQCALRSAMAARRRPVHINLPADMVTRPARYHSMIPSQYRPEALSVDIGALRRAAEILATAGRPGILVGSGVASPAAYAELFKLASEHMIPVTTTPKGKGAFPENHPLSLGVFGFSGHPRADAYLLSRQVDVLLIIGSSLGETATHAWDKRLQPTRALIQIDSDAREIGKNYPVDAAVALRALNEQLSLLRPDRAPFATAGPLEALKRAVPRHINAEAINLDRIPIKPQRVLREMQEVLPNKTLLFVDIGNCMLWAGHYHEVREPGTYFVNMGLGSMGHSIAGAIGGKLAAPDRPVVVLGGDGAFAMSGMEVHTAVEQELAITWIILNDGGHGMVRHGWNLRDHHNLSGSMRFQTPIDIAGLAASLGARSFRVESPGEFRRALEEAMASKRACVIDARVDSSEVPHGLASRNKTLDKFFSGEIDTSDSPTSIRIPNLE